jgi:nicotinamidase-related amidase
MRTTRSGSVLLVNLAAACAGAGSSAANDERGGGDLRSEPLVLHARHRGVEGDGEARVVEETLRWDPRETAIVVCDMWDDHWCAGAARRVAELAPALDRTLEAARGRGLLVLHSPSSVVSFYEGTKPRARARQAPFAQPPVPLSTDRRWGTTWCWPDPQREPALPIDDSDMGCDCDVECEIREAWTRQIGTLRIDDADAITDDGQETFNLLAERGIRNVILTGVHLNMCVLGRPFGIRQMVAVGKNVVLARDLTDTMYDRDMAPFVDHFTGTDFVVAHVEAGFCPSIQSSDLTGEPPFRFAEDRRAR